MQKEEFKATGWALFRLGDTPPHEPGNIEHPMSSPRHPEAPHPGPLLLWEERAMTAPGAAAVPIQGFNARVISGKSLSACKWRGRRTGVFEDLTVPSNRTLIGRTSVSAFS